MPVSTQLPMEHGRAVYAAAARWQADHPDSPLAQAFLAGVQYAQGKIMTAPPVTADVAPLAPEGKSRRTIIAALELFTDQVLRGATEEIASGEWCSVAEATELIQQLKDDEGGKR